MFCSFLTLKPKVTYSHDLYGIISKLSSRLSTFWSGPLLTLLWSCLYIYTNTLRVSCSEKCSSQFINLECLTFRMYATLSYLTVVWIIGLLKHSPSGESKSIKARKWRCVRRSCMVMLWATAPKSYVKQPYHPLKITGIYLTTRLLKQHWVL